MSESRSRLRRVAHEKGEPVPVFDNTADLSKSWHLRNWSLAELRYELRYQQA